MIRLEARTVADAVVLWQRLPLMYLNCHALRHYGFNFCLHRLLPRFFRRGAVTGWGARFLWGHGALLHSHEQSGVAQCAIEMAFSEI